MKSNFKPTSFRFRPCYLSWQELMLEIVPIEFIQPNTHLNFMPPMSRIRQEFFNLSQVNLDNTKFIMLYRTMQDISACPLDKQRIPRLWKA